MPNHVITRIQFFGDKENITAFLDRIKGNNDAIDFEKIIPMPKNIFRGVLGQKERELYGGNNWYDWSISHWGTKWNAYDEGKNEQEMIICFCMAWSAPFPIYERLSEMCIIEGISFSGSWSNEDWSADSGTFESDQCGISIYYDETEEEHLERYADLWGYDPNEEERY